MIDRPIIFSGPMIRALLEGRKTQTRRVINPQPNLAPHHEPVRVEKRSERGWVWMVHTDRPTYQFATGDWRAPYAIGDRLYVREAHYLTDDGDYERVVCAVDQADVAEHLETVARLESSHPTIDWSRHKRLRPGIHMPRWASRLTLIVTDVRVQRLQEITHDDAVAEGVGIYPHSMSAQKRFSQLWDSLNVKRGFGWDTNPWVVAVTFRVIKQNIDQIAAEAG